MAEIVNLRQARKQKKRQDKEKTSAENRTKFGTSSKLKKLNTAVKEQSDKRHQAHLLKRSKTDEKDTH